MGSRMRRGRRWAHLRASGGTEYRPRSEGHRRGASPRERRNQGIERNRPVAARRISARAEEPTSHLAASRRSRAHLRASGGTRHAAPYSIEHAGASPRERRNRLHARAVDEAVRRISARAEEPHDADESRMSVEAHLRASGGTRASASARRASAGASPRERRNLALLSLSLFQ